MAVLTADFRIAATLNGLSDFLSRAGSAVQDASRLPEPIEDVARRAADVLRGPSDQHCEIVQAGRPIAVRVARLANADGLSYAVTLEPFSRREPFWEVISTHRLSGRESTIFVQLALGWAPREIAQDLGISTNTVREHVKSIYRKCGVKSRSELIALALSGRSSPPIRVIPPKKMK